MCWAGGGGGVLKRRLIEGAGEQAGELIEIGTDLIDEDES